MPTILYAEDDYEHRTMMRLVFNNTSYTLIEAQNGQEALEKIGFEQPDLVLLDLFMPKVDGYGVMKALKTNPDTQTIPIVVLSAWPTGDTRKRTKEAGASEFVAKPYDPFELVSIVKTQLAHVTS